MKDLSIIIVNWNTKDFVLSCINSIVKSKPKLNYEIIVVDNGSTDGSVDTLKKIGRIRLLKNEKNLGFAKASNRGIKEAQGKYFLLLNSDTKVKKGTINQLYKFARENPDAGVIGARLLNPGGSLQPSCFRFPTVTNAIRQYWQGKKGLFDKYAPASLSPAQVDVVVGASFLITPQAYKKIGLLDEKYFFFYEDLDYCRRVKSAGLKVYYLPTAEVIHHHGVSVRRAATKDDSWRKLISGSKIYHGLFKHYLISFVLWTGQKWQRLTNQ